MALLDLHNSSYHTQPHPIIANNNNNNNNNNNHNNNNNLSAAYSSHKIGSFLTNLELS